MPDDGDSSNSDSPSILSTVCTLATGAAIIAAGFGIPVLTAASTGLSSLSSALGRSEREFPGGSAGGQGGAGPTPSPEPVNGETAFPMPPSTQTAADAATGAEWLRQAGEAGGGQGHTRVKRVVDGNLLDVRALGHGTFVNLRTKGTEQHKCSGTVIDHNAVLTAVHCVVASNTERTNATDFLPTQVWVGDRAYDCELSYPVDSAQVVKTNKQISSNDGENESKSRKRRDTQSKTGEKTDIDIVLCTTNTTMADVKPVPIMPVESVKKLCTRVQYTSDTCTQPGAISRSIDGGGWGDW